MKTTETNTPGDIKFKFKNAFKKTQQELEEMALQFSLGKAEASDKFEETKKEFKAKVEEWKKFFTDKDSKGKEAIEKLTASFEELQLQLSLGKADAKDYFEKQKQAILLSINKIEEEIKEKPALNELLSDFRNEGDKLKLKLEILQLKFELKKFQITDDFKSAMKNVRIESEKILDRVEDKWDKTKSKYTDFNDEMTLVYSHLKKAIKSL
ncbi:MAG: hypothetical protein EYC69_09705 [Bacteroidetes bacterium]|nr:MAG: hypothetical protein EYC69_09705 [Bacteroidota bacterium]